LAVYDPISYELWRAKKLHEGEVPVFKEEKRKPIYEREDAGEIGLRMLTKLLDLVNTKWE
jgi:hypothetical protein